jgi:hypothetical protein
MRWVLGALAAAFTLQLSATAHAEGAASDPASHARWTILPAVVAPSGGSSHESLEVLHAASEAIRQDLARRGEPVWGANRATERFEAVGSAPAPEVSQTDIDRWVERSRAAVRFLARADYKAARRELKAAQGLADRAAEELNREAARAQQVLDTCLFMVRAYLETRDSGEARRQARECRQLVPRVEPSAFRHTPEVRDLLAEVDAEIAAEAPGILEVTSAPTGCLVRINGVAFERTPLAEVELPAGTYRIQVECSPPARGRIHRVSVASGSNHFFVDGVVDQVVRTQPMLHFEYAALEDSVARMKHAAVVADVLGDSAPLVVTSPDQDTLRLDSGRADARAASVWVAAPLGKPKSDDLARALDALLEGRSVDFTGAHPVARASWQAEALAAAAVTASPKAPEPPRVAGNEGAARPRALRIAGWTTFGVGLASIGTSIGLHLWRGQLGDTFAGTPTNLNDAERWNDVRIAVWTTAAVGGAAASASMPLLLPNHRRTPWWGWVSGAAGLGLAAYAVYEGVTMTGCPEPFIGDEVAARACVDRGQEAGRISLALAGAAPLLTVPLVYLFRPLRAEPSVSVSADGAVVKIRKAF